MTAAWTPSAAADASRLRRARPAPRPPRRARARARAPSAEQPRELVALGRLERLRERLANRFEVLRPSWSDDRRAQTRLGKQPCEREPRHGDAAFGGHPLQRFERVEHGVTQEPLVGLRALRHARAVGKRRVAAVLAREPASGERPERDVADVAPLAQRQQLALVAALEQRERVLHAGDRAALGGLLELALVEVADTVGADSPARHELVEG